MKGQGHWKAQSPGREGLSVSNEGVLAVPGEEEEVSGESPENHTVTWVFPAQVVPVLRLWDPQEWAKGKRHLETEW